MLLSMSSTRVVAILLLCVFVMKEGLAAKKTTCADKKYSTRKYTEKKSDLDGILKTLQDDMKAKSPNQTEMINAYVLCQSSNYEEYYRPDVYMAFIPEMLAVKDVHDKFIPDFNKLLLQYTEFSQLYADNVQKNRYGPAYPGCKVHMPPADIRDITNLNLLIPQKYAAASSLQIKSGLKSIYEKIASGLKAEYEAC
uniref:Uncharacterized protein n=1 Tax=Trichobilharzia regenti TaxID=157069 RepID=A0AA85IQW6_TRIRE|nr:unnamed protein product [Trichobilharzia regenti]